jgi:hypothetical protein
MSSQKHVQILTCTMDIDGYITSNLLLEVVHELVQHSAVPLNCVIGLLAYVLSSSVPYDNSRTLRL